MCNYVVLLPFDICACKCCTIALTVYGLLVFILNEHKHAYLQQHIVHLFILLTFICSCKHTYIESNVKISFTIYSR